MAPRQDGTAPERLMLLDGNGLIYRGYFALPPLTTSKGELVNAVFGFCSIVLRGIQDVRPDYIAVAFDLSAPTFRPPKCSMIRREIESPRPEPAGLLVSVSPAWRNFSKILDRRRA